jgi:hypothetical protein
MLVFVSCSKNKSPEEYPDAILGSWYGKYIGNDIIIHIHSKKVLQIEFHENNILYTTNYSFADEETIIFEKPYQSNKIKRLTDDELEFELSTSKEKENIPFIKGIVFKKL